MSIDSNNNGQYDSPDLRTLNDAKVRLLAIMRMQIADVMDLLNTSSWNVEAHRRVQLQAFFDPEKVTCYLKSEIRTDYNNKETERPNDICIVEEGQKYIRVGPKQTERAIAKLDPTYSGAIANMILLPKLEESMENLEYAGRCDDIPVLQENVETLLKRLIQNSPSYF